MVSSGVGLKRGLENLREGRRVLAHGAGLLDKVFLPVADN